MVHTLLMVQFFDQCLRLLQVFRIKPFREPVVDRDNVLRAACLKVTTGARGSSVRSFQDGHPYQILPLVIENDPILSHFAVR